VAWDHTWYALLGVLNGRQGTVDAEWTISGMADGEPFSVSRANRFSGGISQPGYEIYQVLRAFRSQDVADVRVTAIDFDATVTEELLTAAVGESQTASSLAPILRDRDRLAVAPGDTIQVRVPVDPRGNDTPAFDVDFGLEVPTGADGDGQLRIETGQTYLRYRVDTFAQLLNRIERMPRNDTVRAQIRMDGARGGLVVVPLEYVPKRSSDRVRLNLQR